MSVQLTEEEQVEAIKAFFKRHARLITWLLLITMLCCWGYRYWQLRQQKIHTEASTLYESLMSAVSSQDLPKIRAFSDRLIQSFAQTTYADFARFFLVKYDLQQQKTDHAKALLKELANGAHLEVLKQMARLRLARILVSEQNFDAANQLLGQVNDEHYRVLVEELRGDMDAVQQHPRQAQEAYQKAQQLYQQAGFTNTLFELKLRSITVPSTVDDKSNG